MEIPERKDDDAIIAAAEFDAALKKYAELTAALNVAKDELAAATQRLRALMRNQLPPGTED